jgi:excisionase family DNA binding protein
MNPLSDLAGNRAGQSARRSPAAPAQKLKQRSAGSTTTLTRSERPHTAEVCSCVERFCQEAHVVSLVHTGEYTTAEVAELFGVGRSTVYRAIKRQRVEARVGSLSR